MRLFTDFCNFKPWSGAVDTWDNLEKYDKIGQLEAVLEDIYPDGISEVQLNDILWFEPETVYVWVGLYYDSNTGEVSDEPFDNEDDDDDFFEDDEDI